MKTVQGIKHLALRSRRGRTVVKYQYSTCQLHLQANRQSAAWILGALTSSPLWAAGEEPLEVVQVTSQQASRLRQNPFLHRLPSQGAHHPSGRICGAKIQECASSSTPQPRRTQPEGASETLPPIECLQKGLEGRGCFGTSCQLWWRQETAVHKLWGCTTVTSPFRATSVIISGSDKINQLFELWALPAPTTPTSPHPPATCHSGLRNDPSPAHNNYNNNTANQMEIFAMHMLSKPPEATAAPQLTLHTNGHLKSLLQSWFARPSARISL